MAMEVNINIQDYDVDIVKAYSRVESIYWHRNIPNTLVVIVNTWTNKNNVDKKIPFSRIYNIDLTNNTKLFETIRKAVYKELREKFPEFFNSKEV